MTGSQTNTEGAETRPISVAELLAKNGTIGAPPVTGRRRRRRGNSDAVTVAELTGEIPVVTDEDPLVQPDRPSPKAHSSVAPERRANGAPPVAEPAPETGPQQFDEPVPEPTHAPMPDGSDDESAAAPYWSQPEPRWPASPPNPRRDAGPELSEYPRPLRRAGRTNAGRTQADPRSGAEGMSPDPLEDYADMPVDLMDTDVREAEPVTEDSAYVRSYLHGANELFGGNDDGIDIAGPVSHEPGTSHRDRKLDEDYLDAEQHRGQNTDEYVWSSRKEMLLHGGLVVLQSILAVAFGAGLFIAFDQLWQWNNIVALVLAVLVILGLVAAVQVVRKTVDTASTLIAVAVGALIAFGPLALLQSG
jgi:hypothetical protein